MSAKLFAIPLALGVIGMGLLGQAATAQAAPAGLSSSAAALKVDAADASPIDNVTWRRCWTNGFYTRCWRPAPRVYSFYVRPRPYFYGYYGWGPRRWH